MTWQADLTSLVANAAGTDPTAATVLDLLEAVVALYDAATTPDLPAELANADAEANAAEDAKFPSPIPPTPPDLAPKIVGGVVQSPILTLTNETLAIARQCRAETAASGSVSPETCLRMVRNSIAMTKVLRTSGAGAGG